jgi:hypothetical protein
MGAEPRQFNRCAARFLWIFRGLVQPGCLTDRPWTHIPGYTGQSPIFAQFFSHHFTGCCFWPFFGGWSLGWVDFGHFFSEAKVEICK